MKKDFFADYKRPEWQKFRLEVLKFSDFKCQYCGDSESQLHVHHFFYRKDAKPWQYEVSEMRCLCEECHINEHYRGNRIDLSDIDESNKDEFNPVESSLEKLMSTCARTGLDCGYLSFIIEMAVKINATYPIEFFAYSLHIGDFKYDK